MLHSFWIKDIVFHLQHQLFCIVCLLHLFHVFCELIGLDWSIWSIFWSIKCKDCWARKNLATSPVFAVHVMLRLGKTDGPWKRRANQSKLGATNFQQRNWIWPKAKLELHVELNMWYKLNLFIDFYKYWDGKTDYQRISSFRSSGWAQVSLASATRRRQLPHKGESPGSWCWLWWSWRKLMDDPHLSSLKNGVQ